MTIVVPGVGRGGRLEGGDVSGKKVKVGLVIDGTGQVGLEILDFDVVESVVRS